MGDTLVATITCDLITPRQRVPGDISSPSCSSVLSANGCIRTSSHYVMKQLPDKQGTRKRGRKREGRMAELNALPLRKVKSGEMGLGVH